MAINWHSIQNRSVDPYDSYHSSKVNSLLKSITTNGRLIVKGLEPSYVDQTTIKVTGGIAIKDFVVIDFTPTEIVLPLDETIAAIGDNYIVLKYVYALAYPVNIAKIDVIPKSTYNTTEYLFLGYIQIDSNNHYISNTLSDKDPSGSPVRESIPVTDWVQRLFTLIDESTYSFPYNMIIEGDLTVNGDQIVMNTVNLGIDDNIIVLNKNESGAGVSLGTSGIEIERGTLSNSQFIFDESTDTFKHLINGQLAHIDVPELPSTNTNAVSKSYVDNKTYLQKGNTYIEINEVVTNDEIIRLIEDGLPVLLISNHKVGILTTNTPTESLEVVGNIKLDGVIKLTNLSGSTPLIELSNNTLITNLNAEYLNGFQSREFPKVLSGLNRDFNTGIDITENGMFSIMYEDTIITKPVGYSTSAYVSILHNLLVPTGLIQERAGYKLYEQHYLTQIIYNDSQVFYRYSQPFFLYKNNYETLYDIPTWQPWFKLLSQDPAGGTNADTLDGLDSSQFLRTDINTTANGNVTFNSGVIHIGPTTGTYRKYKSDGTVSSNGTTWTEIYHSGNIASLFTNFKTVDGINSGLDADLWKGATFTVSSSAPTGGSNGDFWFQYV